jgi:hypothetical protein
MKLRKHYFDLVTPDDRLRIFYAAELHWAGLELRYAAVLRSDGDEQPRTESTLLGSPEPERDGPEIRWRCDGIGVACTLRRTLAGPRVDVLPRGGLVWDCHTLRADVIVVDRGETLRGIGYAETVETTVAPWEYPWDELRWGRLHDEEGSFVWTVLEGGGADQAYFARGPEPSFADAAPPLETLRGLRAGKIGETVLGVVPGLERLPGRILGLSETKLFARSISGGRAIHETVRWPQRA